MDKKMDKKMDNVTAQAIRDAIVEGIDEFLEKMKKSDVKEMSRDSLISFVTERLGIYIEINQKDEKKVWLASGISAGMAMVLIIEDKLNEYNKDNM